jgi:hypothetical protein
MKVAQVYDVVEEMGVKVVRSRPGQEVETSVTVRLATTRVDKREKSTALVDAMVASDESKMQLLKRKGERRMDDGGWSVWRDDVVVNSEGGLVWRRIATTPLGVSPEKPAASEREIKAGATATLKTGLVSAYTPKFSCQADFAQRRASSSHSDQQAMSCLLCNHGPCDALFLYLAMGVSTFVPLQLGSSSCRIPT